MKKLLLIPIVAALALNMSCKESASEKLVDEMEEHQEKMETHADNIEDATEYVEEGFENLEAAVEYFKKALEEVEDPKERKIIRERIIKIMDDIELKNQ
ncbi:hypothetical protein [Olleya sp. YS]|uniref:hypothetical protein n=1 Tax=Olleya sp. YS TaxID=3028318 RepID=UPI00243414BF|nr:hypothetical protein [Olleya sp. YS]WGD34996.1 hypothetical protein Ollyesu_00940 [Olleya sp. YS]